MTKPIVQQVSSVSEAGAALFAESAVESVRARGRFVAVLSGGSTPIPMFKKLSGLPDLPWDKTYLLWGDERYVPHDHRRSNYGAAREALLKHVPIPGHQIHAWPFFKGEPQRAAEVYAALIETHFGAEPRFDFNLMGIGDDGHTASIFPGTGAVYTEGLTAVTTSPDHKTRLTMTIDTLSSSRTVLFLVAGDEKQNALRDTLAAQNNVDQFPASAITATEKLIWITDIPV